MKLKIFTVKKRRKGTTNYRKRIRLINKIPRVVIRKSNKHLQVQCVEFNTKGDLIKLSAHTKELKKIGWKASCKNTPAGYLIGLLFGKKAKEKGIETLIPDLGSYSTVKEGVLFAVIKGINDAGVKVPCSEKVLPSEERIKGKHIEEYTDKAKNITKHFEEIKEKI